MVGGDCSLPPETVEMHTRLREEYCSALLESMDFTVADAFSVDGVIAGVLVSFYVRVCDWCVSD